MGVIKGLLEVILYVENMNEQVSFYRDKLGLPVRFPAGLEDYSDQFWVELDAGNCVLALHGGGQRRFGADAPKVVFHVRDINAARESLARRGVALEEIRSPAPGVFVSDGFDPEGNKLSFESKTNDPS